MTIKECYEELGADLDGALRRLMNEKLVEKFAVKFLADESFQKLDEAMKSGDYEEGFRAAHTLKGVTANLGFTKLQEVSSNMTEMLRNGKVPEDKNYVEAVRAEYERTVEAIRKLQE